MVSVSMITYGHDNYIIEAIAGVLTQKANFAIKLIISDDCSPDNTERLVKALIENHPNGHWIEYYRHEKNIGMNANAAFASSKCQGKYVAICEGDDYWTDPLKLQKQVDFLEANKGYGLVYTRAKLYVEATKNFIGETGGPIITYRDLLEYNPIPTLTVCFKRKFLDSLGNFKETGDLSLGDLPLWLTIAYQEKVGFIDEITAVYRLLKESASQSIDISKNIRFLNDALRVRISFLESIDQTNLMPLVQKTHYLKLSNLRLLPSKIQVSNECKLFFKNKNINSLYYLESFKQIVRSNKFLLHFLYRNSSLINKVLRRLV
ncbi:glycosyltransferase [Pedobacter changchengzhani]|uniref:Glycosyltransferase n=1 Tax=Pedobacter changchengzhani TaxID=2529274 RepID=A0A4R5MPI5_9SPHI|nr:glycosyltransferase [Pedobacter changchengzhani]TDG37711.1 glycosyltransferase [Pedobacter changchengzhani]